jgi:hypothetical protein
MQLKYKVVNVEAGGWAKRQGIVPGLDCIAGFVTDDSQSLILFTAGANPRLSNHALSYLNSEIQIGRTEGVKEEEGRK